MNSNNHRNYQERGASLVEYVILVALISITCIVAIQVIGDVIDLSFRRSTDKIAGAGTVN